RIGRSRRVWVDTEEMVACDINANSAITVEYDGNSVKISCPVDELLIGEKITVRAAVESANSECEFEITGGV
ncbi:MAG: hypothetical protein NC299_18545, partial [Lachnospiraceae bacterium]|nr:hypothetical protein [Lachnospiraceae bacterium]